MNDWTEGYVTEVDYTYGFYKEMAPAAMRYALLAAGFEAPPEKDCSYCELGYGQGAGLNLLAAANPHGDFWGTDFNPAHAAGAVRLAADAGLRNLHAFDDSFEQFARRDLPDFDYITLHGVWSWVGSQNWTHIVDFIRKRLKVGGVVYVSYNTLPGWTHALPLRGLLSQFVEYQTAPADTMSSRLDNALQLLARLNEVPGSYFKATPQLGERIKSLQQQNRKYLAHEYLNRHWQPIFFSQMVEQLGAAKLNFAAHANPLNCIDSLNHSKELQQILDGIGNPVFREAVRDMGINQTFRRDLFVRGPRRLPAADQRAALLDTSYALVTDRAACSLRIKTTVGEAVLQPDVYDPLLDRLAQAGPQTARQLLELPAIQSQGGMGRLLQALVVLTGAGYLQPCVEPSTATAAGEPCARFNDVIMSRTARGGDASEFSFLASPGLGSGVMVPRLPQLYLMAMRRNPNISAAAMASMVWTQLKNTAQALVKDGKTIEGDEANTAELRVRIGEWQRDNLPLLKSLAVTQ